MGSYIWTVNHECALKDVKRLLKRFNFIKVKGEEIYKYPVNDWKDMTIKFVSDTQFNIDVHWEGTHTTEIYFDYLVTVGFVAGQLSCYLELMQDVEFIFPEHLLKKDEESQDSEEDLELSTGEK